MLFEFDREWGMRVSSTIYDYENMEKIGEVSDLHQEVRENICQKAINSTLESKIFCYRWIGHLYELA